MQCNQLQCISSGRIMTNWKENSKLQQLAWSASLCQYGIQNLPLNGAHLWP